MRNHYMNQGVTLFLDLSRVVHARAANNKKWYGHRIGMRTLQFT